MKAVSSAQMLQRQLEVKLEEFGSIVARMDTIERKKEDLEAQRLRWKGDVQRRILETKELLQQAKVDCEKYRMKLGEEMSEMESTRVMLLRKLNETERTFEEVSDR